MMRHCPFRGGVRRLTAKSGLPDFVISLPRPDYLTARGKLMEYADVREGLCLNIIGVVLSGVGNSSSGVRRQSSVDVLKCQRVGKGEH